MSRRWVQRTPFGASVARRLEDEERKTHDTGRPKAKDPGGGWSSYIVVARTVNQTNVGGSDFVTVEFNDVRESSGLTYDASNHRVAVSEPGVYQSFLSVSISAASAGTIIEVSVQDSEGARFGQGVAQNSNEMGHRMQAFGPAHVLSAGGWVRAQVFHENSSALTVLSDGEFVPALVVARVA